MQDSQSIILQCLCIDGRWSIFLWLQIVPCALRLCFLWLIESNLKSVFKVNWNELLECSVWRHLSFSKLKDEVKKEDREAQVYHHKCKNSLDKNRYSIVNATFQNNVIYFRFIRLHRIDKSWRERSLSRNCSCCIHNRLQTSSFGFIPIASSVFLLDAIVPQ